MIETPAAKELKIVWQDGLGSEVRRAAISFLLLIAIAIAACLALPALREKAVDQITALMLSKDLLTPDGRISFLALFVSNLQACMMTMFYGLVPFACLVAIPLGINAILLGVLAADAIVSGTLPLFILAIVPHGIVELPALILAFGMGLYVCDQMTRRCRKDKTARSFLNCLILISRFLFLLLAPMLVVAALLESWVTPALLMLFQ